MLDEIAGAKVTEFSSVPEPGREALRLLTDAAWLYGAPAWCVAPALYAPRLDSEGGPAPGAEEEFFDSLALWAYMGGGRWRRSLAARDLNGKSKSSESVILTQLGAALLADVGGLGDDALAEWGGRGHLYVPGAVKREIEAIRATATTSQDEPRGEARPADRTILAAIRDPNGTPPGWLAEVQRKRWPRMSPAEREAIYRTRAMALESNARRRRWDALLEGDAARDAAGDLATSLDGRRRDAFRKRRRAAREKVAEGRAHWVRLRGWPWWPLAQEGALPQKGDLPDEWWQRPLVVETFRHWAALTN